MGRRSGMEFCCCAVPLSQVGGYALVLEGAFVAFVVGLLAFITPNIVAGEGVLPSFAKIIIGILGFATFALHLFGFFTVMKRSQRSYRTYIRLHLVMTLIVFVLAIVFTVVAAAQHSKALASCIALYGNPPVGDGTAVTLGGNSSAVTDQVGSEVCNIFVWAQVGFMALLTILMGITQLYMCYAQRIYGQWQRDPARSYEGVEKHPDQIPLSARDSAVWEPRTDVDRDYDHSYNAQQTYANTQANAAYAPRGQGAYQDDEAEQAAARRYTAYDPYGETHSAAAGVPDAYPSYDAGHAKARSGADEYQVR